MSSLVSVCIPVYNGERYIKNTIEMVLKQDYDNMEILVSDNASTDNTVCEINKIKDERVILFRNTQNLGMAGNWNSLLKKARGDYLIIVCADDYLLPGAIRKKASIMDEYENVGIVFSSSFVMNDKGKKIMKRRPFHGNQLISGKSIINDFFTTKNFMAEPTNNMLRRDIALRVGEFDANLWYTIDWDFWIRMVCLCDAYYIDEPLSGFRVSTTSATGTGLSDKERIMLDEACFLQKYKKGDILPVNSEMLKMRERNVRHRLNQKKLFMKCVSIFSKFFR